MIDTLPSKAHAKLMIWVVGAMLILILAGLIVFGFRLRRPGMHVATTGTTDLTGTWTITVSLTTPYTMQGELKANLTQNGTAIQGTVTDKNGQNSRSITGGTDGEEFISDTTNIVMTMQSPSQQSVEYEANLVFAGTIQPGANQVTGQVTGEVVRPKEDVLAGTFAAARTSGQSQPTPTQTPVPTVTRTLPPPPTATPTVGGGIGGQDNDTNDDNVAASPTSSPRPTATPADWTDTGGTDEADKDASTGWQTPATGITGLTWGLIGTGSLLLLLGLVMFR